MYFVKALKMYLYFFGIASRVQQITKRSFKGFERVQERPRSVEHSFNTKGKSTRTKEINVFERFFKCVYWHYIGTMTCFPTFVDVHTATVVQINWRWFTPGKFNKIRKYVHRIIMALQHSGSAYVLALGPRRSEDIRTFKAVYSKRKKSSVQCLAITITVWRRTIIKEGSRPAAWWLKSYLVYDLSLYFIQIFITVL